MLLTEVQSPVIHEKATNVRSIWSWVLIDTCYWVLITTRMVSQLHKPVGQLWTRAFWQLNLFLDMIWNCFQMFATQSMFEIIKIGEGEDRVFSWWKGTTCHCLHHSSYSHLLNRIHFIIFHCVKLSISLPVCLKIIQSGSSFSVGSVVLPCRKNRCNPPRFRAVLHSSPLMPALRSPRSQQKNQGSRFQKFGMRGVEISARDAM